jgi:hypothetical protein
MASLSKFQTIAPQRALIGPELDRSLASMFPARLPPRPLQPFGQGIAHAFATDVPLYRVPKELRLELGQKWLIEMTARQAQELFMLVGPSPELERELEGYDPIAHRAVAEKFAEEQEQLRTIRQPEGWNRGERARRVAAAEAFIDNIDDWNEALERAHLSGDTIYELGRPTMTALLERTPTLYALSELRRLRHVSSQRPWEPGDLADISALAVAIVYCDVVVTERQWAALIRQAKLDEQNNTVVLSDLRELPQQLI